jgi:hypothetical protein
VDEARQGREDRVRRGIGGAYFVVNKSINTAADLKGGSWRRRNSAARDVALPPG